MPLDPTPQQTAVTVRETECVRYGFECPTCGEWHEFDESRAGKQATECICGTLIKVERCNVI
jgi:hypothetical protein